MKQAVLLLLLMTLVVSACAAPVAKPTSTKAATPTSEARTLTVLTHASFALSEAVLQQFEQANNVKVQFIKQGDAGQALSRAILTKDDPEADVISAWTIRSWAAR